MSRALSINRAREAISRTCGIVTRLIRSRISRMAGGVTLRRRIPAPTTSVLLEGCGHFPVEQPGLDQAEAAARVLLDLVRARQGDAADPG